MIVLKGEDGGGPEEGRGVVIVRGRQIHER